jgi:hypothetical protein
MQTPTDLARIDEYKATLNPMQLRTIEIGKHWLGDSFEIEKSIGFLKWLKITYSDDDDAVK